MSTEIGAAEALEAFVSENLELEELERLVAPFNIFDALGATWHEARHSNFLAFLLDPTQNHGLGAAFTKRFLAEALRRVPRENRPISLVDLDIWEFDDLEVRREWQNVDILLLSRKAQLSVIIENKILSGEHDNQLANYWDNVGLQRFAVRQMGVFLSPSGDSPTDERYLPLGYSAVCGMVEQLAESRASAMGADVRTLLIHYAAMLRRHVLEESEVAELARRIYQRHRAAIELIFEHRPDLQQQIRGWLEELLTEHSGLEADTSSKRYVRFAPIAWDRIPRLGDGSWVKSRRVLVFEIENTPQRLFVKLIIGPGDATLRRALFDWAQENRPKMRPTQSMLGKSFNTIWQREFLRAADLAEDAGAVETRVRERWQRFINEDMPSLNELMAEFQIPEGLPASWDGANPDEWRPVIPTGRDGLTAGTLPAGPYAALQYRDIAKGIEGNAHLLDWMALHGHVADASMTPEGECFAGRVETFLTDPAVEPNPAMWVTEVAILVRE